MGWRARTTAFSKTPCEVTRTAFSRLAPEQFKLARLNHGQRRTFAGEMVGDPVRPVGPALVAPRATPHLSLARLVLGRMRCPGVVRGHSLAQGRQGHPAVAFLGAFDLGLDPERLLNGQGLLDTTTPAVSAEQIAALQQLVAILTDDEKLSTVGLSFDGRRVRRKTGTRDELIPPPVLAAVTALYEALTG